MALGKMYWHHWLYPVALMMCSLGMFVAASYVSFLALVALCLLSDRSPRRLQQLWWSSSPSHLCLLNFHDKASLVWDWTINIIIENSTILVLCSSYKKSNIRGILLLDLTHAIFI